jgi:hypothetical protein
LYAGCNSRTILATESLFREGLPKLSFTPKICYLFANASYYTFRYRLALGIIERNLEDFPYDRGAASAQLKLARCCENLGDCNKAISLYTDFLLEHPKDRRYRRVQKRIAKLQIVNRDE